MTQTYKLLPLDSLAQMALQHGKAPVKKLSQHQAAQRKCRKLSDDDVRFIRHARPDIWKDRRIVRLELAAQFNVTPNYISQIWGGDFRSKYFFEDGSLLSKTPYICRVGGAFRVDVKRIYLGQYSTLKEAERERDKYLASIK